MSKKIHKALVDAIVDGLHLIFIDGHLPDKVVYVLVRRDRRWGSRDRSFIAKSVFELIRFWRKYWNGLDEEWNGEKAELYKVWAHYFHVSGGVIPEWEECKGWEKYSHRQKTDWTVIHSISSTVNKLGIKELGEGQWRKETQAMEMPGTIFIRANTLKKSVDELVADLQKNKIQAEKISEEGIKLNARIELSSNEEFRKGHFEIQDISSQQVIPFLDPQSNETIWDVCAGGGGKSLHLASKMRGKGAIYASDISLKRLDQLQTRLKRAGVRNIHIVSPDYLKKSAPQPNRILIDAPCTGSGVLRREPIKKYRLNDEVLAAYCKIQSELLDSYVTFLKSGGMLVYCTCSIFPSENEKQVADFLEKHREFRLDAEKRILPSDGPGDGFYMARLKKIT